MNKLTALIGCIALAPATFALAGCGNGGSKFVGTWDCGSGVTLKFSYISGNTYSGETNISITGESSSVLHYKNGALVDPSGDKVTIDKNTGQLVSIGSSDNLACIKSKG